MKLFSRFVFSFERLTQTNYYSENYPASIALGIMGFSVFILQTLGIIFIAVRAGGIESNPSQAICWLSSYGIIPASVALCRVMMSGKMRRTFITLCLCHSLIFALTITKYSLSANAADSLGIPWSILFGMTNSALLAGTSVFFVYGIFLHEICKAKEALK